MVGVIVACLVLLGPACSHSGDRPSAKPMRLEVVEGTVSIASGGDGSAGDAGSGSEVRIVDRSDSVVAGDRIVVSDGGIADLTLQEGVALELSGTRVTVVDGRTVALDRGKVLVVANGPVAVRAGEIVARSGKGIFRVDRTDSTRVAVYEDDATVQAVSGGGSETRAGDKAGSGIEAAASSRAAGEIGSGTGGLGSAVPVATYHEAVVAPGAAAGGLPESVAAGALRIDPSDRWDIRYLKDAIDIDARLANLSRGLEAQLGAGAGLDFYRRLLPPGFQVNLLAPMLGDRKTDVLIGSLIAHEVAAKGADEATAVAGVFGVWREGASWGLVAHRFGVGQQALFSLLLDSVNRANLVDQGRGPALGNRRPTPTPAPTRSGPAPELSPHPTPQPSGSPQPSPGPGTPSPVDPLRPVTDLLDQVVQGLLNGLLSPSPRP